MGPLVPVGKPPALARTPKGTFRVWTKRVGNSIPAYNAYADGTLMPVMDQGALAEIKGFEARGETENPRYMQLLIPRHYERHVLRMPAADWPESGESSLQAPF